MELNWQNTLAQLRDYIAHNPVISIGTNLVSLPGEVRPEFYRLFDKIESDFIRDYFPDLLEKGCALSRAWAEASKAIAGQISLESIIVAQSLKWFLNDPLDGLTRSLSDPLFEVLKNKTDATTFGETGKRLVNGAFTNYFKEGYLRWVELAILSLLNPDKNYRVPAVDELADPLMGEGHENPGQRVANVPEAARFNILSFQQHPVVSFVVPKVMVWSVRLGRFIALHSEFVEPYWTAREVSRNAEWLDFTDLKRENGLTKVRPDQKILPDLTKILRDVAIYMAEDLSDITLVADHRRILRPAVSVEIMEEGDWFEKGKLSTVKRHHAVMQPGLGTFIICREPPPQAALDELAPKPVGVAQPLDASNQQVIQTTVTELQEQPKPEPASEPPPDIHIIGVGYDMSRLEPLIEALKK
jgi:hypothetical protein